MTSPPSVAARSLWKLGGLTPGQLGRAVFEEINANNVFGRAAELAFDPVRIARHTLGNDGYKNQKMVCKAVEKMFKQYP